MYNLAADILAAFFCGRLAYSHQLVGVKKWSCKAVKKLFPLNRLLMTSEWSQ